MILHRFHAGGILGGNLKCLALAFVHDYAPEIDHAISHDNTIDYVATDAAGNTSTSTRTVIVESPATTEPAP